MKNTIVLIFVTFCLISCSDKDKGNQSIPVEANANRVTLTDAQLRNSGIEVKAPVEKSLSAILKLSGKIEAPPQNMISVSAPLGGYIKSTRLLPGMKLKKGEIIAVLEDQQYIDVQQEYLTAVAQLKYSETEFERQKSLNETKSSSDKIFQQAEADFSSQKVKVAGLREKLKLIDIDPSRLDEKTLSRAINVYSPIDGFVSKVNVNIGKYVTPSEVLFELVNPEDIHLALTVFEKDIDKLNVGQKLKAYSNNSQKKYDCEIILIGKSLTADRSIEVHCHFLEYDHSLIPGMYMNAEISVTRNNVTAVPDDAIVSYEGKNFIFTEYEKGKFEMMEITQGETEGGFTELKEAGKLKNKQIVVKGAYTLLMSLKNTAE